MPGWKLQLLPLVLILSSSMACLREKIAKEQHSSPMRETEFKGDAAKKKHWFLESATPTIR